MIISIPFTNLGEINALDLGSTAVGTAKTLAAAGGLFESEARHHSTYVRLACDIAPAPTVHDRLHWLASREAEIISEGDKQPRMHS